MKLDDFIDYVLSLGFIDNTANGIDHLTEMINGTHGLDLETM